MNNISLQVNKNRHEIGAGVSRAINIHVIDVHLLIF